MKKALIVFFSASGVTKGVAERLCKAVGGDLFEIIPAKRYTAADLDWMDKNSRSTIEMKDPSCRPPMAFEVDCAQYDVVFIGFPVWWYREPSIIDTFVENTDLSAKIIVPFYTSGSSDAGNACENIAALAPSSIVTSATRFMANVSDEKLASWALGYLK